MTHSSAPTPDTRTAPVWPWAAAVTLVTLAAVSAVYWPTLASMVDIWWRSETFAHGFLVAPISAYMVWYRREDLAPVAPRPALLALPLVLLASIGWFVFSTADINALTQLSYVVMLQSAIVAVLGWRAAWALVFPIAYLWFAVPMGERLEQPLMDFTTVFTVRALELTGIPVYVEGRFLQIPTGNWEVAEACSGIRYLIASLALGTLYAYITYKAFWRRALFIGLAILVPILANGVRAYGIVMLGHLSGMTLAVGVDHIIYGWFFFGLVMLALFMVGGLWRERDAGPGDRPAPAVTGPSGRAAGPLTLVAAGAVTLLVAAAGQGIATSLQVFEDPHQGYVVRLPAGEGGWTGPAETGDAWVPDFKGATERLRGAYLGTAGRVETRLVHYRREGQGAELVNSLNRVWSGEGWRRVAERRLSVAAGAGDPLRVHEVQLRRDGVLRVVWTWYDLAVGRTPEPYGAKFLGVWARLTGAPYGGSFVAVAADTPDRPEPARAVLEAFLAHNRAFPAGGFFSRGPAGD